MKPSELKLCSPCNMNSITEHDNKVTAEHDDTIKHEQHDDAAGSRQVAASPEEEARLVRKIDRHLLPMLWVSESTFPPRQHFKRLIKDSVHHELP